MTCKPLDPSWSQAHDACENSMETLMLTTKVLLDTAKKEAKIQTDYGLAKALEVYPSAVKNYRAGRSFPDDSVAERLADLAVMDKGYVVVSMHALRAGETAENGIWHYVLRKLNANLQPHSKAAAIIMFILSLGFWSGGPDGGALARTADNVQPSVPAGSVYYVNYKMEALVGIAATIN